LLGRSRAEGEGIPGRGSGINNNKVLEDDRAHVWRMVGWNKELVVECQVSNVSHYSKDSAVLLKLFE